MPSVLLIEDKELEAGFLRIYLGDAGFDEFVFCRRLDDALAVLMTRTFDLLILDLTLEDSLPEKTLGAIPKIAARSNGAGLIICSGYRAETLNTAAGYAHAILQKPFTRDTVTDTALTVVTSLAARRTGSIVPVKKKETCPTNA